MHTEFHTNRKGKRAAKLSKYDGHGEEINVNMANTVANIEELLAADDYVFQKLKAVKGK